jgi:hypothetical protein
MLAIRSLVLVFCALLSATGSLPILASETRITIKKTESQDIKNEDYYFKRVLELALRKTANVYGKASVGELQEDISEKRLQSQLVDNRIDLLWAPDSAALEAAFLPVKISLLKELNDYRLLLIRPERQADFSRVRNLDDLRKFRGGMNAQWSDAEIMEANGLGLVKAVGYDKLFKMLAAKRFDYFSRGLYQISAEVGFYPELNLAIEKDLILYYPNQVYFFVNKDNTLLAERVKVGLEAAQKDGSFDALFNSIPRYQWGIEQLKHHKRLLIKLQPIDKATR